MQLIDALAPGLLVQTVDVLRDDGGQMSLLLQPGEHAVRDVRLKAEREHFFAVEPVKILRIFQKEAVADDRLGRVVEFLVVQGVSTVAVKKIAMNADIFTDIMVASRTKSKCDRIAADIKNVKVQTAQVDADNVEELVTLFNSFKPDLVVNLALPYQDLHIMDACLAYGVSYLDTANYEPLDEAKYQYSWQWAYKKRFEDAGLTAILGCGFDPGVTGVYTAYAAKHHFDEIQYLDIVDCNAGDHHKAFATNFNPEINIREITQRGKYFEDGEWKETDPLSIHKPLNYPNVGPRESYLMYHEELESLLPLPERLPWIQSACSLTNPPRRLTPR